MKSYHSGQVVHHADMGEGRIAHVEDNHVIVNFIKAGVRSFTSAEADAGLSDTPFPDESDDDIYQDDLKNAIREVLREEGILGTVKLGDRWAGGELILKPGTPGLSEKPIPIETFFHKIVMVRDRLRVLEQNINSSGLTDMEKVNLQQYITRCYGSLTTFNVLFADKKDWFVGDKKA
ncbi:MAG: hypothetical protein HZA20_05025 [Nitrospirae bacterium]|jgi:hypothetical protein|nr:hypothetical protein [Nitrospirota bacterium]